MREWLSGGAPPCQGGGRGFESRLALLILPGFTGLFCFIGSYVNCWYRIRLNDGLAVYMGGRKAIISLKAFGKIEGILISSLLCYS